MVRSLAFAALSVAVICTSPAFRAKGADKKKPSVGIYVDYEAPPSALAVEAMKREVGSIMKPTGLGVDWRLLSENRGQEAFARLVVVRFKGSCRIQPSMDEVAAGQFALASTAVTDGHVLPFTEVECEQVRKSLQYAGNEDCDQEKQRALGRAMGRVVAHELYHALAGTTAHASTGLAKATQSLRDLVWGVLRFNRADSDAIRQGVTASFRSSHSE
ncbi:MAG TPA: hypothetical protein VN442_17985 [Bryobacteraceae bacterium]|nr:hypothetical protein [Bryobacteraceae bacterium]